MNILLIQLRRIGDLILTTPAIAAVRQTFPDARITLIVSPESAAMGPAIAGVQQVLEVHRGLHDFGLFLKVARGKFDYCVDFTQNNRSSLLTLASGADKRIGPLRGKRRGRLRLTVYNELVRLQMRDMHTVDYNLALLEPMGIRNLTPPVQLKLPASALEEAGELQRQYKIGEQFFVFHPGAARPEKFWEPDRWADLITTAMVRWNVTAVLTGGTSEREKAHLAGIRSRLQQLNSCPKGAVVDLSGKTDLLSLVALIAKSQLVVTVDSAPMHLAAATRIPQVVLFGPTNPFHWHPRGVPSLILQGNSPVPVRDFVPWQPRLSMNLISTQAVIDAMDSLLPAPAAKAL